jgi:hypothetical protein
VTQITGKPKLAAPEAQKWRHFQHKNALFSLNRTHFTNNCSSFVAPAAHLHRQNRLASPIPIGPLPAAR